MSEKFRPWRSILAMSLTALLAGAAFCTGAGADEGAGRVVVLSDIHVYTSGKPDPKFIEVVAALLKTDPKPKAIVLDGDETSGNQGDGAGPGKVDSWWKGLQDALRPLHDAGIAILPVPGNHDSYGKVQQAGYDRAWMRKVEKDGSYCKESDKDENCSKCAPCTPGAVTGGEYWAQPVAHLADSQWPKCYSADVGDVHLSLLSIIDTGLPNDAKTWPGDMRGCLKADLASDRAKKAKKRFAFGHVPLLSIMASNPAGRKQFANDFGQILTEGKVNAYVAGHEHLVWDQSFEVGQNNKACLRQLICGTASATYEFGLNGANLQQYCKQQGDTNHFLCKMPSTQLPFEVMQKIDDGQKVYEQVRIPSFMALDFSKSGYTANPLWYNDHSNDPRIPIDPADPKCKPSLDSPGCKDDVVNPKCQKLLKTAQCPAKPQGDPGIESFGLPVSGG